MKHSRSSHRCFDRYVMIDWSAQSSPKLGKDSIWMAVADCDGQIEEVHNPRTRHCATELLVELLSDLSERVLVGCDFSFGYPTGFADALVGESGSTWRDVWSWVGARVTDAADNQNNRFDVASEMNDRCESTVKVRPFWGHPGSNLHQGVSRYRPDTYAPFEEFRITEHRIRVEGHRPFSSWQLAYPGSVGSQMLIGMAWIERLRALGQIGDRLKVWPFETGLGERSLEGGAGDIVIAEVWPSMFDIDRDRHDILDAAQVITVVENLARADADFSLRHWASPSVSEAERRSVLREEGWTLGVM